MPCHLDPRSTIGCAPPPLSQNSKSKRTRRLAADWLPPWSDVPLASTCPPLHKGERRSSTTSSSSSRTSCSSSRPRCVETTRVRTPDASFWPLRSRHGRRRTAAWVTARQQVRGGLGDGGFGAPRKCDAPVAARINNLYARARLYSRVASCGRVDGVGCVDNKVSPQCKANLPFSRTLDSTESLIHFGGAEGAGGSHLICTRVKAVTSMPVGWGWGGSVP